MKESEIIDLYWERSESAVSATAEAYGAYLLAISQNILRSRADAEECVNDAYLKAWESIPPQRPLNLSAYLGKIVRNLSLNRLEERRAKKRGRSQAELALSELEDCVPSLLSVERQTEDGAVIAEIQRFLDSQPERKRIIFVRRYWYAMPVKEIAAGLGLSRANVKTILSRMRRELKAHLEKEDILL